MSSHVNWMLGLVNVVIVSKVNDSGCWTERVRPALKVLLDGKYINPVKTFKHLNLLMCTCKHTLSLFPSHRLSLSVFLPLQVIYCLILLNMCISKINFKEVRWPIWGSCWFIQMKWLLSKWPQVTDWKRKLSWFFNAFVCLLLGANILFWLWMQLHIMD